jgi:hypothetical protein
VCEPSVGGRDAGWAKEFMQDCAARIANRVQITTDGHRAYLEGVEDAFGANIDYAQLQKIYGAELMARVIRIERFCRSTKLVLTCLGSGLPLTTFMSQPMQRAGE